MRSPDFGLAFAAFIALASCLPTDQTHNTAERFRDIYEFPNGTWIENIAVRSLYKDLGPRHVKRKALHFNVEPTATSL